MTLPILSLERAHKTGSLMRGWASLVVGPGCSKNGLTPSRAFCQYLTGNQKWIKRAPALWLNHETRVACQSILTTAS